MSLPRSDRHAMPAAPAIGSPVRTVEFLGGTPETLVSDGASTEVIRERRDGPKPDRTCLEFTRRCGIAVVLAKGRPREGVKAEACVQRVESRILESLRDFGELDFPPQPGTGRSPRCRRRRSGAAPDLQARYGPAHGCSGGSIKGIGTADGFDGVMEGSSGETAGGAGRGSRPPQPPR